MCVCLCSPGLSMSKETDAKVIEHCSDADIFVYVCNGITTFETTVSLCIQIQLHYHFSGLVPTTSLSMIIYMSNIVMQLYTL